MHNWSDEEMDRMSRDAAERYIPPAAKAGWDALSRRLDVEMPVKDNRRRALLWLFFAGLLLGGTLYVSDTCRKTPNGTMTHVAQGSRPPASSPVTEATRKNIPVTQPGLGTDQGPVTKASHVPVTEIQKGKGTWRKDKEFRSDGTATALASASKVDESATTSPAAETIDQKTEYPEQIVAGSAQAAGTSEQLVMPSAQKTSSGEQHPQTSDRTPMIDLRRPGKWEFAISIAPDLSSVEFYPLAKAGFLGGASIGFHVTERWSISTGLYFTTKHYDSPGEDYPLPGNPMMKMKEVQAACNMWDIPLNLRYDLRTGTRTRFFASAGLSSYLMRKEGMHYYYTYNDIPYDRSYTSKNNQGYLFAVSNISAGLERAIGKGFSVQAEPFAKFSLAEVGTGKIRLNSYGILVGLKYRPFRVLQSRHEPHRNFH